MNLIESAALLSPSWHLLGIVGGVIFYSRFYVQWVVSEREGESTIPEAFWHMSTIGSLTLLIYAIATQSPVGALGQCFNIVVYTRNLVHIWRKKGTFSIWANQALHVFVGTTALIGIGFVILIWTQEYRDSHSISADDARQTWIWLGLGVLGQVLFASRFLIQWIVTERRGECTVPRVFWQLSVVATVLQATCFVQRAEWVFAVGSIAVMFIYFRNLSMIKAKSLEATLDT